MHPPVIAIKNLVRDLREQFKKDFNDDIPILAFIDLHGHSRKKNVFVYGPYYQIHHQNYLKMRVLPKILSEQTSMFRFFASRFKIEKSKEKTARVVLHREFSIMNCFTLEASFLGYFNKERITKDFSILKLETMGEKLGVALYEYVMIKEESEKIKEIRMLQW